MKLCIRSLISWFKYNKSFCLHCNYLAGSGLHTFIMYLGPHVALFTIKAVQCGRVDLKSAPYDTILLKRSPSWLEKDCLQFGPPIYHETIPFSKILQEVCLEAVLWGIGTALGELPPYFLSRAGFVHTALHTNYSIIYLIITAIFSCLSTWSVSSTLSHCLMPSSVVQGLVKKIQFYLLPIFW